MPDEHLNREYIMSTRGAIARPDGNGGFKGVYHHWDSYPSGLGKDLFELARDHKRWATGLPLEDLQAMLKHLIDDHPAGWSTTTECYCHDQSNDPAQEVTEKNASAIGVEWVYVIDVQTGDMTVLSSYNPSGTKMIGMFGQGNPGAVFIPVAVVNLVRDSEPDWDAIGA
jgi:hypothetical protein